MNASKILRLALIASVLVSGGALAGCAAESSSDEGSAQDDIRNDGVVKSKLLGNVAAIRIRGTLMGDKTKVSNTLSALGLGSGDAIPKLGGYRCMPKYTITFLDSIGEVMSTAGLMCDGDERSGVHEGSVIARDKSFLIKGDVGKIETELKKPTTVGDVLYGTIAKLDIKKPKTSSTATSEDADSVKKVLAALNLKQTLVPFDPNGPVARCPADRVITLSRANTEAAADITTMCGDSTSGTATGNLVVGGNVMGTLKIDIGKLSALESTLRWTR